MLSLNQITKIPELIQIMGENFQTDMQPSFITDLAKQVMTQDKPQISSFTILGEGMRKDGIYYGQADEKDVQYAKELINNWMDESTPAGEVMVPDRQAID
ncbi:Transcriptional regulator LytR [compost metagenome]